MQLKCLYSDFGAITIIQHVLSCHHLNLWCSQFNHKCFLLDFTDLFSFSPCLLFISSSHYVVKLFLQSSSLIS